LLFRLNLKYYNGTVVHRLENLRGITVNTDSFAYQSEILIKLLKKGKSYVQVPVRTAPKGGRKSKALTMRNLIGVAKAIAYLVREIYLAPPRHRRRQGGGPR